MSAMPVFKLRVDEEFLTISADIVGELLGSCHQFTRIGLKSAVRVPASKLVPVFTGTAIILLSGAR